MAFKKFSILINLFVSHFLPFFLLMTSLSLADDHESICQSTIDPSYCKNMLANQNGNIFDYGRFSFQKSISQTQKFLNQVNSYLQNTHTLSQSTIWALQDCTFLSQQSLEYLSNTFTTINQTSNNNNNLLPSSQAEDFQTFLSGVLTNQQTCLDGLSLQTSTSNSDQDLKNELSSSLSNDTKLHSVSLALFTKAWVPSKKIITSWPNNKHNFNFHHGNLPLKMSKKAQEIYDHARNSKHGRKLLQNNANNGSSSGDDQSVLVSDIVVVSQDGSGNFTSINDAIGAAPNNSVASDGYFFIFVTEGVYEEYVSIDKTKKYLMMVGEGINRTIITGSHNVVDNFTTFNSATFAVVGQGFVAVNITFRNTAGPSKNQAVALRSGSDLSTFYSCSFEGYQDTLYTHSLRQFYRECDIYGTVDFIFGNAAVVFQDCNIYPRFPNKGQFNTITAQGRTDPNQNTGTSIQNATVKPADDLAPNVGSVQTYLGRPWKNYSVTVFMESFMDGFINSAGWHEWSGDFALSTLYYAEFNNTGNGSDTSNRVTWPGYHVINATDAANFTVSNFLSGDNWIPQTGVPYLSGLN
ncbi:pectinesterase [Arachis hypogaea]|uniref:pectinesterase n=1 Tax=Arachis hypogaea TaxID=3818 RepID=UPI000DED135A|nr:pectinesterase [Arachis hypogaea]